MSNLVYASIGLLLLAIFLVVFRIGSLASILKSKSRGSEEIDESSNSTHGYLFLLIPLVGTIAAFYYGSVHASIWQQPNGALHGSDYDWLSKIAHIVIIVMALVTNAALFYFAFKYRYKKGNKATFYPDNLQLEIIWTIVPAIILTVLVFTGWKLWRSVTKEAPANAVQIEVMGKQFNWIARYPGNDNKLGGYNFRYTDDINEMGLDFTDTKVNDDFQVPELHLVKGMPIHLKIRARDVLHSVSLPHFRQKMDAVPGQPTTMWFVPTKTTEEMREELRQDPAYLRPDPATTKGDPKDVKARWENFDYELVCQEVCGKGHFSMRMRVIVHDKDDYKKWLAAQKPFVQNNKEYVAKAIENQKQQKKAGGVTIKPTSNPLN